MILALQFAHLRDNLRNSLSLEWHCVVFRVSWWAGRCDNLQTNWAVPRQAFCWLDCHSTVHQYSTLYSSTVQSTRQIRCSVYILYSRHGAARTSSTRLYVADQLIQKFAVGRRFCYTFPERFQVTTRPKCTPEDNFGNSVSVDVV